MNNNIEEARVNFENAKLLSIAKFKVPTRYLYTDGKYTLYNNRKIGEILDNGCISDQKPIDYHFAPTLQTVIEWIRVNFNIHIYSFPIYNNYAVNGVKISGYCYHIDRDFLDTEYETPQEALQAALLYTLQNLIK